MTERKMYVDEDIKVMTAIEVIQARPGMYIRGGIPNAPTLCTMIVTTALLLGVKHIVVEEREGGWWYVTGSPDWLGSAEPFTRFVPIPNQVNSHRPEIYLSAFAEDVMSGCKGVGVQYQQGERCPDVLAGDLLFDRWIAFRMGE